MFQKACRTMGAAMAPIILMYRDDKGRVGYSLGAGLILSEEGWVLTAAHIVNDIREVYQLGRVHTAQEEEPLTITHFSTLVGSVNLPFERAITRDSVDIGVIKIQDFVPEKDREYPRLRSASVEAGEFLCRIGFPFVEDTQSLQIDWNEKQGFIAPNLLPTPAFVNEALVSRILALDSTDDEWIETSSPGLRGQSGGPLADVNGLVCGIQVNTAHYPLGFRNAGRNQVLNVGRAVEVGTVRRFLDSNGIRYYSD